MKRKMPKIAVTTSDNRMGTAKAKTPVKVKKSRGPTRPPRVAAAAPMPNQGLNSPREFHDPEGDMHTLTRAESIRADKARHAAAVAHGKKKLAEMAKAVKVSTRDV